MSYNTTHNSAPNLPGRVAKQYSGCHYPSSPGQQSIPSQFMSLHNTLHNTRYVTQYIGPMHNTLQIHYTIPITQYTAQFQLRNTLNNTQCKTHKTHNTQCKTVFRIVGEVFWVATPLSSFNGGHHPSNFFTISIIINLVYLTFVPSILSPMQILMGAFILNISLAEIERFNLYSLIEK